MRIPRDVAGFVLRPPEHKRQAWSGEIMSSSPSSNGSHNENAEPEAHGKWDDKKVFTTGEAAEICKVSQQTIIRCFDAGRLHGFRVPGSRFRRIPRDELIRFMQTNEIPLEPLLGEPAPDSYRILVVEDDPNILEIFEDTLGRDDRFEMRTAATGYDAGMLTESFRPHLIVLDYMLPDINGNVVCERLRANPDLASTRVIFVSGVVEEQEVEKLVRSGADDFLKKPFSVSQLLERIESLLHISSE
jgi:excisionase family DNA binding protein